MKKLFSQSLWPDHMGHLLFLTFLISATIVTAQAATHVVAWGRNLYGETDVPQGLSNVVAIAAAVDHSLALRSDGTIVAWGCNLDGESTVPSGLNDVVSIAAGDSCSLALKRDGTVVAWGWNPSDGPSSPGQTNVPAGLTDVVQIAPGCTHILALRANGDVVGWGYNFAGQGNIPAGLSNVVAVAGGYAHALALKADGTVVYWGRISTAPFPLSPTTLVAIAAGSGRSWGLRSDGAAVGWRGEVLPEMQQNIVQIAAGYEHLLGLKRDGTVVASGNNYWGEANVPSGLTNVIAIATRGYHNLALVSDSPLVRAQIRLSRSQHVSRIDLLATRGQACQLEFTSGLSNDRPTLLPIVFGDGGVKTLYHNAASPLGFYQMRPN